MSDNVKVDFSKIDKRFEGKGLAQSDIECFSPENLKKAVDDLIKKYGEEEEENAG
jgi:hypothetical protein